MISSSLLAAGTPLLNSTTPSTRPAKRSVVFDILSLSVLIATQESDVEQLCASPLIQTFTSTEICTADCQSDEMEQKSLALIDTASDVFSDSYDGGAMY